MPWTLGDTIHVNNLHAASDLHIGGEAVSSDIVTVESDIAALTTSKAPKASPTFTGAVTLPSTTTIGSVSSTELGYLDGVTSPIQAQLDSKLDQTDTHTAGTGVTIDANNEISIGQSVGTGDTVRFGNLLVSGPCIIDGALGVGMDLEVNGTTLLRGQATIDNILFDERTDSVISGTTYNIHSSVDNTKNLLIGFQDTTGLKKYWKTFSAYARSQIDLVTYNESFGLPTSATLIRLSNTGTASTDVINYVAQGNHNFYENDFSKNGIINTARINLKDYAIDNTEYCSIRSSKINANGGQLEFYVKDNNGDLEERMTIKKNETTITNNTGKLKLDSINYSAITGSRVVFSMTDPNNVTVNESVRIRHNVHDGSSPSGAGTPFGLIIEKDSSNTENGAAYLEVEGRIYAGGIIGHHGVSLNETTVTTSTTQITSLEIDEVIKVDGAVNLVNGDADGYVTFLSGTNFVVGGSYVIQVFSNDSNAGTNGPWHYNYIYSGVMSWSPVENTDDSDSSQEIPLHGYGRGRHGFETPAIKLRTLSRSGGQIIELQIADQQGDKPDNIFEFTFKMRRML